MLANNSSDILNRILLTTFLVGSLFLSACAPPAAPAGKAPAGGAAAPTGGKVELEMLVPSWGGEPSIPETQIKQFMAENPAVTVHVTSIPADKFDEQVLTRDAAGMLPDVLAATHYLVARFHQRGILEPLEDLKAIWPPPTDINAILKDFLPDALDSDMFPDAKSSERLLRAIPWRRYGCTPKYLTLVAPKAGKHLNEVHKLIEFLTRVDVQVAAFTALKGQAPGSWPTRIEAYKQLQAKGEAVVCPDPESKAHRLYSSETDGTLDFIQTKIGSLEAKIAGEAAAVLSLSDEDRGKIEYSGEEAANREKIKENIQAAAVPVVLTKGDTSGGYADPALIQQMENDFAAQLEQPGSAIVGALFVKTKWEGIPPANYIIDCSTAGLSAPNLSCKLTGSDKIPHNLTDYDSQLSAWWADTKGNVGYPMAMYETGSPGQICVYIKGHRICFGKKK